MIKNVVFDVGNVLVAFRWREMMDELHIPKDIQDKFEKSVFGGELWHAYDHGLISDEEIYEKLRENNKEHIDAFEHVWAHRDELVRPFDYAVPWIKTLKREGLGVYIISNYPKNLFTMHEECGAFPFLQYVDGKIVSGAVKMIKPQAEIYEELLKQYHLKASECVFIDDLKENVEGAKAVGMQGIWLKSYEQANAELRKLL